MTGWNLPPGVTERMIDEAFGCPPCKACEHYSSGLCDVTHLATDPNDDACEHFEKYYPSRDQEYDNEKDEMDAIDREAFLGPYGDE